MNDLKYLKLAVKLSKKGLGYTEPNPMVGAVVVKNERILSTGYHKKFGDIHAERMALDKITEEDTTLFVSLEPCCHHGKTPPCTDLIIKKKVKKVVIASIDPNPLMKGKGIETLKSNGIEVVYGQLDEINKKNNKHYFVNKKMNRPFITLRAGVSIDGKLTDKNRNSKWMTNKQSREISHDLRSEFSAIMTGYNTVIEDNPNLNIRTEKWKDKKLTRIILDTQNRLSNEVNSNLNIFKDQEESPTYIFSSNTVNLNKKRAFRALSLGSFGGLHFFVNETDSGIDLNEVLKIVYNKGISSILVEGGGKLISSFFKEKLFDELILFTDKKIIGGKDSVEIFENGTLISDPVIFSKSNLIELDSGYIFMGEK